MIENKRKILILVEGAKTEVALMKHLSINIYTLYHEMFEDNNPADIDLLQLLKSREPDPTQKVLFNDSYSDVLLMFDLDPQDPCFAPKKVSRMAKYFVESSDMGKLYINYPMVEAFYHMASIPDPNYDFYFSTLDELLTGKYKARVNRVNRNHDYRKFATSKMECNTVIKQNISKAWRLTGNNVKNDLLPAQSKILNYQLHLIHSDMQVAVLNTCVFFIPEYNPELIQ